MWLESFAYIFFLFSVDAKASLVETRVFKASLVRVRIGGCWNQKFLDYEIETHLGVLLRPLPTGWNQKFLDYEIETYRLRIRGGHSHRLESKVSRLRD